MADNPIHITATEQDSPGERIIHYRATELSLVLTLDDTFESLAGANFLFADLLPSSSVSTPILAQSYVVAPSGFGPFEIDFSGAQLNQSLDGLPRKEFWLAIYATYASGGPLIIHKAPLLLNESGIGNEVPLPPNVDEYITKDEADALYALKTETAALSGRIDDLEEGGGSVTQDALDEVIDDLAAEVSARQAADVTLTTNVSTLTSQLSGKANTAYVDSEIAEEKAEREADLFAESEARLADNQTLIQSIALKASLVQLAAETAEREALETEVAVISSWLTQLTPIVYATPDGAAYSPDGTSVYAAPQKIEDFKF